MKQRAITNNILEPRGSEKNDQCHTQFQLSLSILGSIAILLSSRILYFIYFVANMVAIAIVQP